MELCFDPQERGQPLWVAVIPISARAILNVLPAKSVTATLQKSYAFPYTIRERVAFFRFMETQSRAFSQVRSRGKVEHKASSFLVDSVFHAIDQSHFCASCSASPLLRTPALVTSVHSPEQVVSGVRTGFFVGMSTGSAIFAERSWSSRVTQGV